MITTLAMLVLASAPPVVIIVGDNTVIDRSCTVRIDAPWIADAEGNGVIQIAGSNLTVDFSGAALRGCPPDASPDDMTGTGLRITGKNVTVRNLSVSGFKAGIHASDADGLVIEDCVVSGNFRQRLKSSPRAEDSGDWLWPHRNDRNQWLDRYGAGVYVEDSTTVTIRRVRAREGQNGIILDRVNDSKIYDNDCSFLSGWGLAMWRSSRNTITRNAFDFCARGYSHGVYNRGQDSAGILMFEQCTENLIAENSATHGGDGLFGYGGEETLASSEPLGNNDNLIINNDFSDAVAHGIEMTFSFRNRLIGNRLAGNAICGFWGGYSQDTLVVSNQFIGNGQMAYGQERGGINIEHGRANRIIANSFKDNACGVFLWWDEDPGIMKTAWARANERGSADNHILGNRFDGGPVGIQLRRTTGTRIGGNTMQSVAREIDADDESPIVSAETSDGPETPAYEALGDRRPVGARDQLRGRDKILMTQWGPYDWQAPMLQLIEDAGSRHVLRLLGADTRIDPARLRVTGPVQHAVDGDRIEIVARQKNLVSKYEIALEVGGRSVISGGAVVDAAWSVRMFPWSIEPMFNEKAWRDEAELSGVAFTAPAIDFRFGAGGPSQLGINEELTAADLPLDKFGVIATATLSIPPGRWRVRTESDDGLRVWMNNIQVIGDWTRHTPKTLQHFFTVVEQREYQFRVEYFELDGFAVLSLALEPAE